MSWNAVMKRLIYYSLSLTATIILKISRPLGFFAVNHWDNSRMPWFDHRFNWLLGPEYWTWNERGVYGAKLIREGDKVLDVCCGDGIYSGLFYSMFAGLVHGIDRNAGAIAFAKKHYPKKNVEFIKMDIVKENFPLENYDVIFMFAAIEHFSVEDGTRIVQRISKALSKSSNGVFLGSTPIFKETGGHGHPEHDNEFTSIEQFKEFFSPHFDEIELWSSKFGLSHERKDTYFLCRKPKLQ